MFKIESEPRHKPNKLFPELTNNRWSDILLSHRQFNVPIKRFRLLKMVSFILSCVHTTSYE